MKKLGLIGGIGPESTLLYYKTLVYALQHEIGPTFFPNLAMSLMYWHFVKTKIWKD